jgi:hypothetical protein
VATFVRRDRPGGRYLLLRVGVTGHDISGGGFNGDSFELEGGPASLGTPVSLSADPDGAPLESCDGTPHDPSRALVRNGVTTCDLPYEISDTDRTMVLTFHAAGYRAAQTVTIPDPRDVAPGAAVRVRGTIAWRDPQGTETFVVLDLEVASRGFAGDVIAAPEHFSLVTSGGRYGGRTADRLPRAVGSPQMPPCDPRYRLPPNGATVCSIAFLVPTDTSRAALSYDDGVVAATAGDIAIPERPTPDLSGTWYVQFPDDIFAGPCTAILTHATTDAGELLWIGGDCGNLLSGEYATIATVNAAVRAFEARMEGSSCATRLAATYAADGNTLEGVLGCNGDRFVATRLP